MAVTLYSGTPGSGKSLEMASDILFRLRVGRAVVANFEIDTSLVKHPEEFTYCPNDVLSPEWLEQFAAEYFVTHDFKEGAIRLFIDECQIIFSNRDWNAKGRKEWIRFFTQHRKLGYDIVLVAQFDSMIDKQIRALIEYEVKHRKANNFGWFGAVCSVLALGNPVVVCVRNWYPMRERIEAHTIIGRQKYYKLYDTYKMFDTSDATAVLN